MTADRSGYADTTSTTSRSFVASAAIVFGASAATTIYLCRSMSVSMPMPGGWSMSMAWMRMPGQSWLAAGVSFLGMWTVMMIAMMLPAIVPVLRDEGRFALPVAAGYFTVWAAIGAAIYPMGIALANAAMRSAALSRSVPLLAGAVVIAGGAFQLSRWKARELACCRASCDAAGAVPAFRSGLRLGFRCALCCAAFMSALLVIGVMDLAAMAVCTAAITIERVAPRAQRVLGLLLLAIGTALVAAGGARWI